MWDDAKFWVPHVLRGSFKKGEFSFTPELLVEEMNMQ